MAFTSQLKNQLDLPTWRMSAFSPAASVAGASSTSPDNPRLELNTGRYIYFLNNLTTFVKYDTVSNGWSFLATPPIAPLSYSAMKFAYAYGFQNKVISATSNTITAGFPNSVNGYKVKIISGTGAGQERIITGVGNPVINDIGVATAANLNSITNTNKSYTINQYAGYLLRTTGGTGQFQTRKIMYNSATVLTIADPNKYAEDLLGNSPYVAVTPYAVPAAGTNYQIESNTFTVDQNWDVTPDSTSVFKVFSGGIYLVSSAAATPFYTLQYYDVLSNQWYIRNGTGGNVLTAAAGEVNVERTGESASIWVQGKATSGSTTTLVDTNQEWDTDQWKDYYVRIFSGSGKNQIAKITSNTVDTLTFGTLGTAITSTSQYMITGFDGGIASSAATTSGVSTLVDSSKTWETNRWNNMEVEIVAGTGSGQSRQIRATSATTLTVYPAWSTIPDNTSIYVIHGNNNDLLLSFNNRPELYVYSNNSDITLRGREFEYGSAKGVSVQFGDDTPLAVSSATYANPTLTVTTVNPHNFRTGNIIKMRGDTGAGAAINNLAAGYTCTVTGANTFTLNVGAGSAAVTVPAQSTSTLVDGSKNWTTNQWAGYIVTYNTAQGPNAAHTSAIIASNTATTLTFVVAGTAPAQGISRYSITAAPSHPLKSMIGAFDSGVATGTQSTTTLQDTSKTWVAGSLVNRYVVMQTGTGLNQALLITANTTNTLTFAAATAPVSAQTAYSITQSTSLAGAGSGLNWVYGNGTISDSTKGAYIIRLRGAGLLGLERFDIRTDSLELLQPQDNFEVFTTGTSSAYDGTKYIYISKESVNRLYVYDVVNNRLSPAGYIPFSAQSTALVGNRMEIYEMIDTKKAGIKFLWLNKNSLSENVSTLLFWEK